MRATGPATKVVTPVHDTVDGPPGAGISAALGEALVRALMSASAVGFALLDRQLRYLVVNDHLARVNGRTVGEHLGRPLSEVCAPVVAGAQTALQRVLDTGEPLPDVELSTPAPDGGARRHWSASLYPVPGDEGPCTMVMMVTRDVSARVEAERTQAQTLALLDLLVLRAPIGIAFLDRDLRYLRINQALAGANGVPIAEHLGRRVADVLPHVAPYVEPQLREVLATGRPVTDLDLETGDTPAQPGRRRHWRVSYYPVPAPGGGPPEGVGLIVVDRTQHHQDRRERDRLRLAERGAARRAEHAAARQALLQRLTAALAATVTTDAVAQVTVSVIGEALGAEAVTLCRYDAGRDALHLLAQRGLPERMRELWPLRVVDHPVARQVLGDVRPVLVTSFADRDRQFPEMVGTPVTQQAWANLPLIAEGEPVGMVAFGWTAPRPFPDEEVELLQALASQCAVARDRAGLYTEPAALYAAQARVARRLQDNLLPEALPAIPGLDLAARYFTAEQAVDVGGDFYDVFGLDSGGCAAVIGDVTGRGIDAAGTTALARHTLRALGDDLSPAAALRRLNTLLYGTSPAQHFLTAAYAHLRPLPDGAWTMTLARAGHPPPLTVRPDRSYAFCEPRGILLGASGSVTLVEAAYRLEPGDTLVLYTDGVTETHGSDGLFGEDRLAAAAATTAGRPAAPTADAILSALDAYNTRRSSDDRALLVVHLPAAG